MAGERTPAHEVRDLLTFLAVKRDLFVAEVGAAVTEASEGAQGGARKGPSDPPR